MKAMLDALATAVSANKGEGSAGEFLLHAVPVLEEFPRILRECLLTLNRGCSRG